MKNLYTAIFVLFTCSTYAQTQYAATVIGFSSQWGSPSWAATQATGVPDTYPSYGDITTAWASSGSDNQREYLVLGFATPMMADSVFIYETYNPGAVDTVYLRNSTTGMWNMVYQTTAASAGSVSRILKIGFTQT